MIKELLLGKLKYLSFVVLDIICLLLSNYISYGIYINFVPDNNINYEHTSVVIIMILVDLMVTLFYNSIHLALRRRIRVEIYKSFIHVLLSFCLLTVILFMVKRGSDYSRLIVLLAYVFDFIIICLMRYIWKQSIKEIMKKKKDQKTALLMTTDRFLEEGIEELKKVDVDVERIFLLQGKGQEELYNIMVLNDLNEVGPAICWEMIDRVYIYGLDHQMVPEILKKSCDMMKMKFELVDFNYRVIEIKTIKNDDPRIGALSFLESMRDIPFPIRRAYWITETEASIKRGFHAHKLNCQLLYCPYGKIDIILDDGEKRDTVTLDRPGKGLILMPGLWREMVWLETGSVLCVLASEFYDASEYIRNYDDFIAYNRKYRKGS